MNGVRADRHARLEMERARRLEPYRQRSAQRGDALAHAEQAEPGMLASAGAMHAVVAHRQHDLLRTAPRDPAFDVDRHALRIRVSRDVRQSFLHKPVEGDVHRFVPLSVAARTYVEAKRDAGHAPPPAIDAMRERRREAE